MLCLVSLLYTIVLQRNKVSSHYGNMTGIYYVDMKKDLDDSPNIHLEWLFQA